MSGDENSLRPVQCTNKQYFQYEFRIIEWLTVVIFKKQPNNSDKPDWNNLCNSFISLDTGDTGQFFEF